MYSDLRKAYILASYEQSLRKRCEAGEDPLSHYSDLSAADSVIEELERNNVTVVTREDSEYPDSLRNIYDSPVVLYAKGDISLLKSHSVAVVGTRRPTRYGKDATIMFARALANNSITVVSGLARGVDSIAHRVALDCGGKTIAVIGCGIDRAYPAENRQLMREIEENGLVISEYPLGTPPLGFRFPERNRIISGLSAGVLVTEAGLNSGSLITADCAVEQGKDLWLVPGSIFSKMSEGCNSLLKEYGKPVTCVRDIIDEAKDDGMRTKVIVQLTFEQRHVLQILEQEGNVHYSRILEGSGMSVQQLSTLLMQMELDGMIKRLSGNYYCIANS